MPRYCFILQVRIELLDDYRRQHVAVWPDMLCALRDTGWTNYSLFLSSSGLLIGYVEAVDLVAAQGAMARTEVNGRWQEHMSQFFEGLDGASVDEGFQLVPEVFHLEAQLEQLAQLT